MAYIPIWKSGKQVYSHTECKEKYSHTECKEKYSTKSVQSSLKSHPLWVTLYIAGFLLRAMKHKKVFK